MPPLREVDLRDQARTEAGEHIQRWDQGARFDGNGRVVPPRGLDARINERAARVAQGQPAIPPRRRVPDNRPDWARVIAPRPLYTGGADELRQQRAAGGKSPPKIPGRR